MPKIRGTSNAPLVLGVVGGSLGFPASVCSGMCIAKIADSSIYNSAEEVFAKGAIFMGMGLIAAVLAIIASLLSRKYPKGSGTMMIIAAVLMMLTVIGFNLFSFISMILLVLAAIFCFTQKKVLVEDD